MGASGEYRGSCKTLVRSIGTLRNLLGTRGPWKRSIGLRAYHDELLLRLAQGGADMRSS